MEFKEYTAKDAAVADGYTIRYLVFCEEDGFTQDEEFDDRDATAIHIVGYVGNKPVSNVRLVQESVGLWHLGRLCVLKEERGKGSGRATLTFAMEKCRKLMGQRIVLGAKTEKKSFYEKHGFITYGEEFSEGGIPHIMMKKDIED